MPIRVCQLIAALRPSGPVRCVYELASRLDKQRFAVDVVSLRGGLAGEWFASAGIPTTVLGTMKLPLLTDVLRRGRYDIVHTHQFAGDLAGRPAARLAAVPHLVHTVHVVDGRFRPWQYAYARLLSGYCDRLVCVSQSVMERHVARSGIPQRKYIVIPNGVDAASFGPDGARRDILRKEWGVAPEEPLFVFVGRLDRQKGVDTLLAAISHLGARGTPARFLIVGQGPMRRIVQNFIARGEGGRYCRLLRFVSDIRDVYHAADALVMPSRWEGWPLVLGEAMAAGLPAIVARAPGLSDIVRDGQTGLTVDVADAVGLAEGILQLAGDAGLRQRMGQAGRDRVMQEYPLEACVRTHEALYEEVAGA